MIRGLATGAAGRAVIACVMVLRDRRDQEAGKGQ